MVYFSVIENNGAYPSINQSRDKERHSQFLEEVYQMGGGFSSILPVDSSVSRRFPKISPQKSSNIRAIYYWWLEAFSMEAETVGEFMAVLRK